MKRKKYALFLTPVSLETEVTGQHIVREQGVKYTIHYEDEALYGFKVGREMCLIGKDMEDVVYITDTVKIPQDKR